jgi:hypothetical protein
MQMRLFWQGSGSDGFFDLSQVSGPVFADPRVSRGAAFADYDEDGDVDVLVMNHQDAPWLLRNDTTTTNRWLKVRAECGPGGLPCPGATVEIETAAGRQRREIGSQSSYLSQNAPEAVFGVGSAESVADVRVRFPSGVERILTDVETNQTLRIRD